MRSCRDPETHIDFWSPGGARCKPHRATSAAGWWHATAAAAAVYMYKQGGGSL